MFASQAGLVIANARRYRDEHRARADLETLVHTSPGGRGGLRREDGRHKIRQPGGEEDRRGPAAGGPVAGESAEELDLPRGDGREVSLEEFSLAQALSAGETVRAEEIVMQVPGGESVTTLVGESGGRSGPGHLQGHRVSPRRPHPGGKRRPRPRHPHHLHPAHRRGDRPGGPSGRRRRRRRRGKETRVLGWTTTWRPCARWPTPSRKPATCPS